MTLFDALIQNLRIHQARRFLAPSARVLDIGCSDGALFRRLPWLRGIGIDPDLFDAIHLPNADLFPGYFPAGLPSAEPFDAITLLAVLEHLPAAEQLQLAADCFRWLKPGGRVILTVPSPLVDHILVVLRALRIMHAETFHQHYGFDARHTPGIFKPAGFALVHASRFELRLNHLFVFEKPVSHT